MTSRTPSEEKYSEHKIRDHLPKKRTGKKKKGELEQNTIVKQFPTNKQMLLDQFCRKTAVADTNTSSQKSEQFLQSQSSSRIQELEQDLKKKDEQIKKLQGEKERQQLKLANISSEYKIMVNHTREVMIKSTRELAEMKRKEQGTINPKMGYFADSNCNTFVEGVYLYEIREQLRRSDQVLQEITKKIKGSVQQQEKDLLCCRSQFLKKQINELKEELIVRQREIGRYKDRLKLRIKQQHCQMNKEKWPFIKNRYLPLELIGSGGFGQVYKAFDFERFTEVALKISLPDPRLSHSAHQNLIKHLKRQLSTHKQLHHPNIVRVIDQLDLENSRFGLVMEYCSGPQLKSYLKKMECLDQRQARSIIKQLIFAVRYLHQQKMKVVHFDLKPANILFHHGVIKIVDFGICKLIESQETKIQLTSPGIGTYWYLPPQVFEEEKAHVSSKVDIWSIGVIFFQLLYGKKPFGDGIPQGKIMRQGIILNAHKVEFPADTPKKYRVSHEAKEFIKSCLTYNAESRLSSAQAAEHQYIAY